MKNQIEIAKFKYFQKKKKCKHLLGFVLFVTFTQKKQRLKYSCYVGRKKLVSKHSP